MERKHCPTNTTFQDFLSCGWGDICSTGEENWESAIKKASGNIDDGQVRVIVLNGPDWN